MTTKTLHSIGIEPITGPGIDGNPSSYYPRKSVVLYVTTRERSRQKNRTGYTKLEACKILKIKNSALFRLVQKGFINLVRPGLESQGLIKQCDVDNFYKKYANSSTIAPWLKTSKFTVDRIFSQLGITPVSGPSIDASPRYFYAVSDILTYFRVIDLQKYENSNPELEPLLMNTSILKEKYGVSALAFGRLFIKSGFTSPVRIGHTRYLLRADVKRVKSILDNYHTISQANKYLGGKQNIDNLIKTKKLTALYPLIDYINSPMIERRQLQDYAIQYCYV